MKKFLIIISAMAFLTNCTNSNRTYHSFADMKAKADSLQTELNKCAAEKAMIETRLIHLDSLNLENK